MAAIIGRRLIKKKIRKDVDKQELPTIMIGGVEPTGQQSSAIYAVLEGEKEAAEASAAAAFHQAENSKTPLLDRIFNGVDTFRSVRGQRLRALQDQE